VTAGSADSRLDTTGGLVRDALPRKHTRLQVLFLVALLGVALALGLGISELAGPWASLGYAVLALILLYLGAARARAAQERTRERVRASGRTCTCCTSTQHDPVEVI
jgi:membrane protein implicated in regulation of membrane protease activity